jgi:ABC-type Mn2+/Zn2+ transport system ATPase subunit
MSILRCESLTKTFLSGGREITVLRNITFELEEGGFLAVVGPSGSGKSTLLGLLAGLVRPTAGSISLAPGRQVAFVAQQQHQHRWMPLSVEDVLRMGRYAERGLLGRLGAADRAAIEDAARRLDVVDLRRRPFGELSGGQRQRVLVAQALASSPDLLLLDEPITGLDLASQERILEIIATETASGTAVVLSTHHLGEARRTDRVLLLAGCIVASGRPEEVLRPSLLAEAFGNRLVSSGPETLVVDEHGHAHDDCPDGEPEAAELLPQHDHDHHAHRHPGVPS